MARDERQLIGVVSGAGKRRGTKAKKKQIRKQRKQNKSQAWGAS
jgi:hypothetical protein